VIKALFLNAYRGLSNLRSGALDGRFGGSWRAWLIERQQARQPAVRALWAVFTLELLALLLLQLPSSYNFSTFVFYDPGSIMRAEWLIEFETIFDREADRYLLLIHGWDGRRRVHGCLIHVDIINGKI
jgi:hypothetical protein